MEWRSSTKTGHRWGVLDAQQATGLLGTRETLKFFWPFLNRVCTAQQAAQEAGVRLDTMLYRIERFLELGLLSQVPGAHSRSRKQYRAVADRLLVPFEKTHFETLVELMLAQQEPTRRLFAQQLVHLVAGDSGGWMVRIHRDDPEGRSSRTMDAAPLNNIDWEMTEMLAPNLPATWYSLQGLPLTDSQAKALQHDLLALWKKYDSCCGGQDQPRVKYILELSLVPVLSG